MIEPLEVAKGVYRLIVPLPWELDAVHVYLIDSQAGYVMVDCGLDTPESRTALMAGLDWLGINPAEIHDIIVTHIHPDHFGAAGTIKAWSGGRLWLHRLELPLVAPRYLDVDRLLDEVHDWLVMHGTPADRVPILTRISMELIQFVAPATPDVVLEGQELLQVGQLRLQVIWTPGHSPGHVCLYDPDRQLLFTGDQLVPGISANIGQHPQSLPDPLDDYLEALCTLRGLDVALVLPSHEGQLPDHRAEIDHLLAHHRDRLGKVLNILETEDASTGWDVAIALFGKRELHHERLALQETLAHLQALSCAGCVAKEVGQDGIIRWCLERREPAPLASTPTATLLRGYPLLSC